MRPASRVIAGGREHRYDRVIVATHADTALALLAAPTADERRVLGAFRYSTNRTVLHRDRSVPAAPPAPRTPSWNYVADPDTARVAVTYSMTRLQGLPDDRPYLVTLEPAPRARRRPRTRSRSRIRSSIAPRSPRSASCRGSAATHHTYYAGAHFGFGFHEDGLRSGLAAAARIAADRHRRPARA